MTAEILPFPLVRRRDLIIRQARYASQLSPDAVDRYIARQILLQTDTMRRKGVHPVLITRETRRFEAAVKALLVHRASGGIQ